MRVEDLEDVEVADRPGGAVLVYDATRRVWRTDRQVTAATKADIDEAITLALATLRVR